MTPTWHSFRSALALPFLVALFWGIVIGLGPIVVLHGLAIDWEAAGNQVLLAAGLVLALLVMMVVLFRVYVSEQGLRCYTFWGNYRTLAWHEIHWVRPFNLLGLRYLRVGSLEDGAPLWVPLFLADLPGFQAAVSELAGEGHVLTRALASK